MPGPKGPLKSNEGRECQPGYEHFVGSTFKFLCVCQADGVLTTQETCAMSLSHAAHVRHEFYKTVWFYFRVVWPIFSILIFVIVLFGLIIGYLEGWKPFDGIYFAFVTGLTIGYGDLAPKLAVSRVLAIMLGFNGVLMTAIFAAISIRAIEVTVKAMEHGE